MSVAGNSFFGSQSMSPVSLVVVAQGSPPNGGFHGGISGEGTSRTHSLPSRNEPGGQTVAITSGGDEADACGGSIPGAGTSTA
jgi:hypothetical protein